MAIIIKENSGKYWLYSVSHTPFNFTPFTNPSVMQDWLMLFKQGEVKDLCGLDLDKEYDLEIGKDFIVVARIPKFRHDNGLVYDYCIYQLKSSISMEREPITGSENRYVIKLLRHPYNDKYYAKHKKMIVFNPADATFYLEEEAAQQDAQWVQGNYGEAEVLPLQEALNCTKNIRL